MSRKTFLILVAGFVLVCAAVFFFFMWRQPTPSEEVPNETPCLVFQGTDSEKPCYLKGSDIVVQPPVASSTPTIDLNTPTGKIESVCGSAATAFEKNDCITNLAQDKKDKTICDYVVGSLAQAACKTDLEGVPAVKPSAATPNQTYQAFVEKYFSDTKKQPAIVAGPSTQVTPTTNEPQTTVSPSTYKEQVAYNLSYGAPLAVYAASRYQAAPGSAIKIFGSGFTSTSNVLNIGIFQTVLNSSDGNTLDATAPLAVGEYEIWVTNQKGSSKVAARPVKITVTESPAALPVILKATPSIISVDGTVELSGTGFGSTNNILTSLGILMDVPSTDGRTIRFAISSLPYAAYAKAADAIKGKVSPVMVNIQTTAGASEKTFQFDVQF